MTLLAGFVALLSRYTGQADVAVGTPIANRTRAEIEGLIGFFVNTLVLRTHFSGERGFQDLLAHVRQTALAAYTHQEVPFERVVQELSPERDPSRTPLFQVSFLLNEGGGEPLALPGLTLEPLALAGETAKFDLTLALSQGPAGLSGALEYDRDLFERATAERLVRHFATLLAGVVGEPRRAISETPLLTAGEQQQLLAEWAEVLPFAAGPPLHRRFEEQARRAPGAPALVMGDERRTYGELDRQASRLARRLRQQGVGLEVVVGICLERSPALVVALLGVLKAGGAYLPLDPAYPAERLAFLLADAAAPVIVTERRLAAVLPESAADLVYLDELDERTSGTRGTDRSRQTRASARRTWPTSSIPRARPAGRAGSR